MDKTWIKLLLQICVAIIISVKVSTCYTLNRRTDDAGIIGGDFVEKIEDYPHSVLTNIYSLVGDRFVLSHICSASPLNHRVLLSAAHCADIHKNRPPPGNGGMGITAGQIMLSSEQCSWAGHFTTYRHKKYNEATFENDINLIVLMTNLQFSDKVKKVSLVPGSRHVGETAIITGWGEVKMNGEYKYSEQLKFSKLVLYSDKKCREIIPRLGRGQFCAGSGTGSPSKGDGGSALMATGNNRSDIQIGIMSFRPKRDPSWAVFIDVDYYKEWIEKTMEIAYCDKTLEG